MASTILSELQRIWPFSLRKPDDLKFSNKLVRRLPIPENTKEFVFAFQEPDSHSVVYVLAAQNLSEQSALDAECLIKVVQPKAVLAQVASSVLADIQSEEKRAKDDRGKNVPTSSVGVLKGCFLDKLNKQEYETLASSQILQEIFGVGFYGHFLAAKTAAEEVDSKFIFIESPYDNVCPTQPETKNESREQSLALHLEPVCLLPGKSHLNVYSSPRTFCITGKIHVDTVKSLIPCIEVSMLNGGLSTADADRQTEKCQPGLDYQVPSFAQSIYPLLTDLYNIFFELPAIAKALSSAQNMLLRVSEGKPVDPQLLSEVQNFRIAAEGLRIALNDFARCPLKKLGSGRKQLNLEFAELSSEEKCHALSAYMLRSQARKFGSVVAIVDASSLAGIRRHWNTSIPNEIADLASECFLHYSSNNVTVNEEHVAENLKRKRLLADKPVVAVSAGASAIIGASSLSKVFPASTLIKIASYKVPVYLKLMLAQFQRTAAIGLAKILGPSKLIAPSVANAGTHTSTLKLTFSAEKIRTVTHTIIASVERTSLLAMRTSFYEIMRRRRVRSFRFAPWAAFGCSVGLCSGLLLYGDGIECAAEAIPSIPVITNLGRGLQNLQQVSQEVRQSNSVKIKEALQSLMYNLKKLKVQ